MANIPVYCPHCNLHFETPRLFSGTGIITFTNSKVSCPNCGQFANIVDGTYLIKENLIQFFSNAALSFEDAHKLIQILEAAQHKHAGVDEIKEVVQRNVPRAAGITKFFVEGWNLPLVLTTILSVLMWMYPRPAPDAEKPESVINLSTNRNTCEQQPSKRTSRRQRGKTKVTRRNQNNCPK